jgi:hypothetical protein
MKMGFLDWLMSDTTTLTVTIPKRAKAALETLVYLRQDEDTTMDTLVSEALDEYLKKNLWATKQKTEYTTEVKKAETYTTGMRQRRTGS